MALSGLQRGTYRRAVSSIDRASYTLPSLLCSSKSNLSSQRRTTISHCPVSSYTHKIGSLDIDRLDHIIVLYQIRQSGLKDLFKLLAAEFGLWKRVRLSLDKQYSTTHIFSR